MNLYVPSAADDKEDEHSADDDTQQIYSTPMTTNSLGVGTQ